MTHFRDMAKIYRDAHRTESTQSSADDAINNVEHKNMECEGNIIFDQLLQTNVKN